MTRNIIKLEVHMVDEWIDYRTMKVELKGTDGSVIIGQAGNANTARSKAIQKLKNLIKKLEEMNK